MSNKTANVLTQVFTALMIGSYIFSDFLGFPLAITAMFFFGFCIAAVRWLIDKHPRERLYQRLEQRKLPRIFRKYLQSSTPEMEREGFEPIGDFLIYPEPMSLHSRAFLCRDGRCFGFLAQKCNVCFFGFLSVFQDGTYLESCALKPGKKRPSPDAPIQAAFLPGATLAELAAFHRREIERIESQQQTRVMECTAEQYAEVSEYGHRLADWDLYQQGFRWTGPQPRKPALDGKPAGEQPIAEPTEYELVNS